MVSKRSLLITAEFQSWKNVLMSSKKIFGEERPPLKLKLSHFVAKCYILPNLPWIILCIFGIEMDEFRLFISLQLRMIRASLNRGSRLGPKTSVQGKPCAKPWDMKILVSVFQYQGENCSFFKKKCWIPWVSCFYFAFQDISSKKIFFQFFFWQIEKFHHQFT